MLPVHTIIRVVHFNKLLLLMRLFSFMWKWLSVLAVLFGILFYYWLSRGPKLQVPSDLNPQYDYIIVGGGTAGAVLAARLSEDPETSVLLLEAGPPDYSIFPVSHIPLFVPFLQQTSVDWQYVTLPQTKACMGLNEQKSRWPRGKVLGGTGVLNYMIHTRASPRDHNGWVNNFGCIGWGWEDVLKYYKNLEHTNIDKFNANIRGTNGKVECVHAPQTVFGRAFIAAAKETGYQEISDYNDLVREDFDLKKVLESNETSSFVSKSIIGKFVDGFRIQTILSPDSNRTSLLSWPLVEILGFLRTGYAELSEPDIQAFIFPTDVYWKGYFSYLVNLKDEVSKSTFGNLDDEATVTIATALLHPRSKGEIRLQSADPFVSPNIDPKYLQDDQDAKRLAQGLNILLGIMNSSALAKYKPEIAESGLEGCKKFDLWSESYFECFVRHKTFSMYHPVGTCRMGSDPNLSVVDTNLRVHGIKGLRIVDASVFPTQVSGNTNIPVTMIAEKASDMIKNGY